MALRQVPPGVNDPNLRGFLNDLRNAIGKAGDQINRLTGDVLKLGTNPGGPAPAPGPGPGEPETPPPALTPTITVLSVDPVKPKQGDALTLTAQVSGNNPTGTIRFTQDGNELELVTLEGGTATYVFPGGLSQGVYSFQAFYLGDSLNYPSSSNIVTVEVGSIWDGPPDPPYALEASSDDPFVIRLKWQLPYIGDYAVTEIWGAKKPTNVTFLKDVGYDEGTLEDLPEEVIKLGEVASTSWVFSDVAGVALEGNEEWYFWVRNRDTEGRHSYWHPDNATESKVSGATIPDPGKYLDILTGSITETHLFSSLGDKIDLIVPLQGTVTGISSDILILQDGQDQLAQQIELVAVGGGGFDSGKIWYFDAAADITGWTTNAGTLAVTASNLTFTPNSPATAPAFTTVAFDAISGVAYSLVRIRVKRGDPGLIGSPTWSGTLSWWASTNTTGTPTGSLSVAEPDNLATDYAELTWDLHEETGWTANSINKLRFALSGDSDSTSSNANKFSIDWMAVGRNAPGASAGQVANLERAQLGYCLINGSASNHESKAACEAAGGTWLGNYPLAQSVKQVSVTDGISTGTIEQKFTAQKLETDGLRLQYTVKIDNQGYVSGLGLASEPVNGVPYSDFMVRADRFSISNPTIPSWQKSVSSLTHNGTVAIVTTSAAHGYSTGQYVMLANVADKYWNRTFKITSATPTDTTFQIACSALAPLSLNPAAASPATAVSGKSIYCSRVVIPFIVTTSDTVENGVTIPAGVYIDSAQIKDATITEAKIRNGSIVNAKIGNYIASDGWPSTNGIPSGTPQAPFSGWRLAKDGSVEVYGGFALYDSATGNPIISAGKIDLSNANVKRLVISAVGGEVFAIGPSPSFTVAPATITLSAGLSNLGSPTVTWTVTSGTYSGTLGTGQQKVINPAQMSVTATFKATCTVDGVTYDDVMTLTKVEAGSSALLMTLSNESDAVTTDASGTISGTITVSSNVRLFRGATNVLTGVNAEASPAWTVTTGTAPTGTTYTYNSSTGLFQIGMTTASPDRVVATITATRGSETVSRDMTVVKQKQGAQGPTGSAGTPGTNGSRGSRRFQLTGYSGGWGTIANNITAYAAAYNACNVDGGAVLSDSVELVGYGGTDNVKFINSLSLAAAGNSAGWSTVTTRIHGSLLVDETVGANAIAANSITADRLAIGVAGKNLLHNSGPTKDSETVNWFLWSHNTGVSPGVYPGWTYPPDTRSVELYIPGTPPSGRAAYIGSRIKIPVIPNQIYEASVYLSLLRCNGTVDIGWYDAGGNYIFGSGGGNLVTTRGATGAVTSWPRSVLFFTAPSTAAYATFLVAAVTTGETNSSLFATHMYFGPGTKDAVTGANLVSPWSPATFQTVIDGSGIRTGSVTADQIAAQAITADNIQAGAISADKLSSSQVWSKQITLASGTGNYIISQNYSATDGFIIDGDGNSVFNRVIVRKPGNLLNDTVTTVGYGQQQPSTTNVNTGNTNTQWTSDYVYVYPSATPQRVVLLVTVQAQAGNNNPTNVGIRVRRVGDSYLVAERVFSLNGGFTSTYSFTAVDAGWSGTLGYYIQTFNNWNSGSWINNFISTTVVVSLR